MHRSKRCLAILCVVGVAGLVSAPVLAGPPAARAAASPALAKAEVSFDQFARRWMQKMERAEEGNRSNATPTRKGKQWQVQYRAYGGAIKTRLRSTGYAKAPFVGVLEYAEELMVCDAGRNGKCRVAGRTPVTEIFRYQDGRWIY